LKAIQRTYAEAQATHSGSSHPEIETEQVRRLREELKACQDEIDNMSNELAEAKIIAAVNNIQNQGDRDMPSRLMTPEPMPYLS
jgi:hypothetical protein